MIYGRPLNGTIQKAKRSHHSSQRHNRPCRRYTEFSFHPYWFSPRKYSFAEQDQPRHLNEGSASEQGCSYAAASFWFLANYSTLFSASESKPFGQGVRARSPGRHSYWFFSFHPSLGGATTWDRKPGRHVRQHTWARSPPHTTSQDGARTCWYREFCLWKKLNFYPKFKVMF